MAYEFSVALRASCALVTRMTLAHGVYRRVENSLTALMVRSTGADSVVFRGAERGGQTAAARAWASPQVDVVLRPLSNPRFETMKGTTKLAAQRTHVAAVA